MPTKAVIPFLVAMMLLTGVCNTLLTKYQDMQCVRNCADPDPKQRQHFEQPVIQTAQMFVGEMGCWLVIGLHALYTTYLAKSKRSASATADGGDAAAPLLQGDQDGEGEDSEDTVHDEEDSDSVDPLAKSLELSKGMRPLTGWRVGLLALPACCDIAGTTLMNVGLLFVAASIYQMTRGALVLFVGLFSVLFLKRSLGVDKWFALFVVVAGVAIVGLAGAISRDEKAVPGAGSGKNGGSDVHGEMRMQAELAMRVMHAAAREVAEKAATPLAVQTVIGVLLIAAAQIFTATQFVLEESIMEKYSVQPLQAVGWEGVWGFLVTVLGMIVLHFSYGVTDRGRNGYFDAREGLREVGHNRAIAVSSVLIMISIGGFNFFGLSVTRTVSATSRSTIDTCRTLFIWIVSLGLGWETFKWLQVVGFALLVYGTFLFNDLMRPPLKACMPKRESASGPGELLPEGPIEHN